MRSSCTLHTLPVYSFIRYSGLVNLLILRVILQSCMFGTNLLGHPLMSIYIYIYLINKIGRGGTERVVTRCAAGRLRDRIWRDHGMQPPADSSGGDPTGKDFSPPSS